MIQYNLYGAVRDGTREVGAAERETGQAAGPLMQAGRPGGPADFSKARFAPRCLLALVAPFRGAKSSHNFRAPAWGGRLFQGAVCSPLPARPYASVSGSKIFTQFPHPHQGPAGFSMARFAPRCLLALVAPFRGANFFTSGLPTPLVTSRPPMYNCYV